MQSVQQPQGREMIATIDASANATRRSENASANARRRDAKIIAKTRAGTDRKSVV
jgi:hypothetical protein